jgi:hypothetical protein
VIEVVELLDVVLIVDEELLDELELLVDTDEELLIDELELPILDVVDTELDDVEDEVLDVVVVVDEEDDDGAVPWAAVPCIKSSVYPPSLQNVRYDAEIPSEFGRKISGIFKEAPAAKVDPTAGKFGEV